MKLSNCCFVEMRNVSTPTMVAAVTMTAKTNARAMDTHRSSLAKPDVTYPPLLLFISLLVFPVLPLVSPLALSLSFPNEKSRLSAVLGLLLANTTTL